MFEDVKRIAEQETFSRHLGVQLVEAETDRVVLRLPYQQFLGAGRVHGGAIASLVDLAATCAMWSHPEATVEHKGATVGFSINFLHLVRGVDLTAVATVRRRGGSICVGDVSVRDPDANEVAIAHVTYKLNR